MKNNQEAYDSMSENLEGTRLNIFYVPVQQVMLWEDNPKKHDMGAIIESIQEYGFRDPPAWDEKLGAIVEGNGRSLALGMMENQGYDIPKGILLNKDDNVWCMPVLFGVDAESKLQAEKYAIDHNNLTMMGGDFSLYDISKMWENDEYRNILNSFTEANDFPVTISLDAIETLNAVDTGVFDDESSDSNGIESTSSEIEGQYIQYTVTVLNTSLAEDVHDSILNLLEENSGWEATIYKKDN